MEKSADEVKVANRWRAVEAENACLAFHVLYARHYLALAVLVCFITQMTNNIIPWA